MVAELKLLIVLCKPALFGQITAEIIISHFESVRWKKQIIVNLMSLRRVCRGFHFRTTLEACFINDFQVIEERSRAKH